jgi:hypothetical protein
MICGFDAGEDFNPVRAHNGGINKSSSVRIADALFILLEAPVWQTNHAPCLLPGDGRFACCFSLNRKLCSLRNEIDLLYPNVISINAWLTEASRKSRCSTMQRCQGDCPLQVASLTAKGHAVIAAPVNHRWLMHGFAR